MEAPGELEIRFARVRQPQDDVEAQHIRAKVLGRLTSAGADPVRMGRYLVIERLGAGAMGVVYAAYDPQLDRKVAIKIVQPEADTARLEREGTALGRLAHPNVVAVHDVIAVGDGIGLVMEMVEGLDLEAWLRSKKRRWNEIVPVFAAAGRGLAAAHDAGIFHRDFKPANVVLGADGRVRVLDFGLASAPMPSEQGSGGSKLDQTSAGAVLGTAYYMAPEQHRAEPADAASDQYAFCVALFEAAFGRKPFEGSSVVEVQVLKEDFDGTLPPDAGVPGHVRSVIARGLSPDPSQRFASMPALVTALERDRMVVVRRTGVFVAVGSLGIAAALLLPDRAPDCDGAARLEGVWDEARAEQATFALLATQRSFAADTADAAVRRLDAYRERWLASYGEACEATRARGEQSEAALDLRMQCLNQRRADLGATVELLVSDADSVVDHAVTVVDHLPTIDRCDDIEALRSTEDAAPTVADVEAEAKVRERMAGIEARLAAGDLDGAVPAAQQLLRDTDGVLRAELLLTLARAEGAAGHRGRAVEDFTRALEEAERAHADDLRAQALLELIAHAAPDPERRVQARGWGRQANAVLDRIGGGGGLRAELSVRLAHLELEDGRPNEAIAHASEAVEHGSDRPLLRASAQELSAHAHLAAGDAREAANQMREVVATRTHNLGAKHPEVAFSRLTLASMLAEAGQREDARVEARAAGTILDAALDPSDPGLADIRREIARILSANDVIHEP